MMHGNPPIDVLIPTYNNPQYLYPCVQSLLRNTATPDLIKVHVINNGDKGTMQGLPDKVNVIEMGHNANWCGGLKAGLEATSAPYVLFCNDDIHVPACSRLWASKMLQYFAYPECAAVGPSSNFVMGHQAIWSDPGPLVFKVPFLIGFFLLLRRDALIAAGGIDTSFTCGDDLDLSLRLRKMGKLLLCDKDVYIHHHGAKTGTRVEGSYWYSADQQIKTWNLLFQKHGVKTTFEMLMQPFDYGKMANDHYPSDDLEGDVVRSMVKGGKTLELGCGGRKTVSNAIGVDLIPKGSLIPGLSNETYSVADHVGDVEKPLPFDSDFDCVIARHILEHVIDPVEALRNWSSILKHGGRLILAVPDQTLCDSIPMNPEHIHAFTPASLGNMAKLVGLKEIEIKSSGNQISFVGAWEKSGVTA